MLLCAYYVISRVSSKVSLKHLGDLSFLDVERNKYDDCEEHQNGKPVCE